MITDFYRIKTQNSVYEVQVNAEAGASVARKSGDKWREVKSSLEYLEKLYIGASFDIPGVVLTSVVQDYQHFVISDEPKRHANMASGMSALTAAIVGQVKGNVAVVGEMIGDDEESYH